MRKFYGEAGYQCGMVLGVWCHYFMKMIPLLKFLMKNFIQIVARISAYHFGMYIFGLELHPAYVERLKSYYNQFCDTDLHVTEYVVFLIECVAVVYISWFWYKSYTRFPAFDLLLKFFNIGVTVNAGIRKLFDHNHYICLGHRTTTYHVLSNLRQTK
ncbi:hypothetical protein DPMN_062123 [Dreissena polymorpha]|uniref:Uncharacterized protein n=1 Tax=Dreissena polymorpha TaxID=45954 RepID=A0A9D4C893_DREPO|nr:hypothetical protein DPMN_062123 [Dreissena polymorpha]